MKRIVILAPGTLAIFTIACNQISEKKGSSEVSSSLFVSEEGFVDSQGVLIYYKALGRGESLVILHGGPGASHDYFLPYLLPLIRRNRVIFIDELRDALNNWRILRPILSRTWQRMWKPFATD